MKHYLVEYSEDWADEFDLTDQTTMTEEELTKFKDELPDEVTVNGHLGNVEAYNEHSKEDYLSCLSIREITEEEAKVLNKFGVLGGNSSAFDFY